jgi:hypothetical protein
MAVHVASLPIIKTSLQNPTVGRRWFALAAWELYAFHNGKSTPDDIVPNLAKYDERINRVKVVF